jgi:hypothetical protein
MQANGVANLHASLRRVAQTGASESMAGQRYDARELSEGGWRGAPYCVRRGYM